MTDCSAPYVIGEKCRYQCKSGYGHKSGDTIRTCTSDRSWSGRNINCRPECPPAPNILNATKKECSKKECVYRCDDGYEKKSGDTLLRCSMVNGKWIGTEINCQPSG
ncbi:CUB and sushi domain-containing protein 3-like [Branchiostoma floridae]|uniref:CUB and sushi domain-containing protein 3-like n=1 Tax=Branchiostoma floridae TaxID=7739 RepID=A0A9J7HSU0_BRAFL|nr:CUB and sushi domain-containing protein 3-like [Branchiostoma floridae]